MIYSIRNTAMKITVNGEGKAVGAELTVVGLLDGEDVESPNMVAVQLNGTILERSEYETTTVKDGDTVEFLYFMGGGNRSEGSPATIDT